VSTIDLDALHRFVVRAKQATYVGTGKQLLPYRLGSHDLQYDDDDWTYHDSYLGESDFIGQEIVYRSRTVVWGMNYFGRILHPERITSAQAGQIIRVSLSKMYTEGRFLGGFEHREGGFRYVDTSEGDVASFRGREWIAREAQVVYELVYHGGVVRD
jgi:hypothetical protein